MRVYLVWLLVVGFVSGWLAGQLTKGRGFSLVGNIVLGVCGALVGGFLLRQVGIYAFGTLGTIIVATIGSIVLIALARAIR
jgi:uncharacterized membrane protein YeaQ/YmgE (transglycosylase-associated protein family)